MLKLFDLKKAKPEDASGTRGPTARHSAAQIRIQKGLLIDNTHLKCVLLKGFTLNTLRSHHDIQI